jgi:hypothetical protein
MQVVTSKLVKLGAKSSQAGAPAEVIIRRRRRSRSASGTPTESWEMVRARGHHDEVLNLVGAHELQCCTSTAVSTDLTIFHTAVFRMPVVSVTKVSVEQFKVA